MSNISPRKLRNRKTLTSAASDLVIDPSQDNLNLEMKNNEEITNEQAQSRSDSPSNTPGPRQASEKRLNHPKMRC